MTTVRDIAKPEQPITDPRKLAGVLAEIVTNYPHLMARTGGHCAQRADGSGCHVTVPEAVRFCATGMVLRLEETGAATPTAVDALLVQLSVLVHVEGDLTTWWENGRVKSPAEFVALLHQVAAE